MRRALPLLVALLMLPAALASASPRGQNFGTHLTGDEEVPPVDTKGQGQAVFHLDRAEEEMGFRLTSSNLNGPAAAAHIHCGPEGANGPVGVTLFGGPPTQANGTLASGTITGPDPGNGCGWADLAAVVSAMRAGDAYVNVHSTEHAPGEIRGQIEARGGPNA